MPGSELTDAATTFDVDASVPNLQARIIATDAFVGHAQTYPDVPGSDRRAVTRVVA